MEELKEAIREFQIIKTPSTYFSLVQKDSEIELRFNVDGLAYASVWKGSPDYEGFIRETLKL